jgi:hypothetical protein
MIDSQKLGQDIAVALGLDPKATQSIDLHIKAGELVTCDISQIVTSEGIGTAIAKNGYILTPIHRPPTDAGAGWRFVEPDERIEKGDEYFSRDGKWTTTNVGGYIVSPRTPKGEGYAYRRKVIPVAGDGFRLLGENEVIENGDEAFVSGMWMSTKVGNEGRKPKSEGYTYRRATDKNLWRHLGPDEIIRAGDEYLDPDGKWQATRSTRQEGFQYRRKIEWRWLNAGEIVRPGDEIYKYSGSWILTCMGDWGKPASKGHWLRRRLDNELEVGEGWAELKDGDAVTAGDEILIPAVGDAAPQWRPAFIMDYMPGSRYRRRLMSDLDRLKAELASEKKKRELLEEEVARRRHANEQMCILLKSCK